MLGFSCCRELAVGLDGLGVGLLALGRREVFEFGEARRPAFLNALIPLLNIGRGDPVVSLLGSELLFFVGQKRGEAKLLVLVLGLLGNSVDLGHDGGSCVVGKDELGAFLGRGQRTDVEVLVGRRDAFFRAANLLEQEH